MFTVTATANSRATEADVYLDDRYIGTTSANRPLVIGDVSVGRSHRVRVNKEGFEPWSRRIRPETADTNHVSATLQPSAVFNRQITFRRVSFADRIVIDDRSPGYELPAQVDLPLGQHTLRYVDSASSFAWETRIVVSEVSINEIAFMAEHIGYGELSVVLTDAARYGYAFVVVNGQLENKKTTPFRLKLPVGRHRIQVLRDGFRASPSDTVIFVPLDAEVNILCSLRPE